MRLLPCRATYQTAHQMRLWSGVEEGQKTADLSGPGTETQSTRKYDARMKVNNSTQWTTVYLRPQRWCWEILTSLYAGSRFREVWYCSQRIVNTATFPLKKRNRPDINICPESTAKNPCPTDRKSSGIAASKTTLPRAAVAIWGLLTPPKRAAAATGSWAWVAQTVGRPPLVGVCACSS